MPKTSIKLEQIKLVKGEDLPYTSDGEFSTHEVIVQLLKQTGPAAVRVSSFSVTEMAIRSFLNLQESGLITELKCLFDFNVKRHRLGLLFFASNVVSQIRLTKVHAKLVFIRNEEWSVVVITSANLNINDKKEVGMVITSKELFDFYSNHFNDWFHEALPVSPDEFN